jgi:hypothetical protein
MNPSGPSNLFVELARDLRAHLELCHECLALFTVENRRLRSPQPWQPAEFSEQRKRLLPRLESVLIKLRGSREFWQKLAQAERERCGEIKNLFQEIQNLLPRILMLDRENQQEMLRRGALPATQLPPAAGQQPNFVASLYQRHAAA